MIQGDIAEMTVDAVIHPTNASFSLSGQCGQSYSVFSTCSVFSTHACEDSVCAYFSCGSTHIVCYNIGTVLPISYLKILLVCTASGV